MSGWSSLSVLALLGATFAAVPDVAAQSAPVRSIADAIAKRNIDSVVTIAGRAVVAAGKLQSSAFDVAIDDGTGGIRLFSRTPRADVEEGDSITATGTIKGYRGSIELVVTRVAVIAGPLRIVPPLDVAVDPAIVSRHAGQLVRVHGRMSGSGHSEGGQWLRLRDADSSKQGTLTVWVPANHGAPIDLTKVGPQDSLVVTGVATSYQDNRDDPVVWQVVPRDAADVEVTAAPRELSAYAVWVALVVALLVGAVLAVSRIGARRHLRALQETETRYRQLLALLPDAVIVHAKGSILFTNPATAELLGLPSDASLVGRQLADFVHADSQFAFTEASPEQLASTARLPRSRARLLGADGSAVDVEVTSSPCVYHDQPAMVMLARDITAQLRYERDLHALALVDELTGLQNRRAFTLFAEQELARARRHNRTPVVVYADLDGLKQINDEHGHAAGDLAIRLVANALRSIFRETDIVARWSGDEFVALMVEGSEEASQLIESRLDAAIALQSPPNLPYVVTATVGATPLDPALPLRDAMERADVELYAQKKRAGRGRMRRSPVGMHAIDEP
ncbi:MAG: diguanylate cyclase [bacterium]